MGEETFFRLVRSRTPGGTDVDEIPTRRPFDDPKIARVYHRFARRLERPLEKTHMPYPLSAARLRHFKQLFSNHNTRWTSTVRAPHALARRSLQRDPCGIGHAVANAAEGRMIMSNLLWAVAAVLLVMWMLGFALHFTLGGLIHLLLVLAIIAVLVRVITGRRIA